MQRTTGSTSPGQSVEDAQSRPFSVAIDKLVKQTYNPYRLTYRYKNVDAISYTAARANLAKTMEKVCNDHSPVIITRKSESPVVMLSLADYQAMEETTYLLRSPANARHLLESIAELETGKGTERALLE